MSFFRLFGSERGRVSVIATRTRAGRPVRRIGRNSQPLYEERGWRTRGSRLIGEYIARGRRFRGEIENPFSRSAEWYVFRPPRALLEGSHGACFSDRGGGRFHIHWATRPRNVNEGLLQFERCLAEVL